MEGIIARTANLLYHSFATGRVEFFFDYRYPSDVPHKYDDKYKLAELLTQSAYTSQLQALAAIGLTEQHMQQLREWAVDQKEIVTLRFTASEECISI